VGLSIPSIAKAAFPLPESLEAWATLPFVRPDSGRLYACNCSAAAFDDAAPARPEEHSWEWETSSNRLGWHCAGHPVPEIPLTIDGITIEEGWALDSLVSAVLSGENPARLDASAKRCMSFDRAMWLVDLYHVLPEPWSTRLSAGVAACLGSNELAIRAAALSFHHDAPEVKRPDEKYKHLFEGQRDPLGQYYGLDDLWARTMAL